MDDDPFTETSEYDIKFDYSYMGYAMAVGNFTTDGLEGIFIKRDYFCYFTIITFIAIFNYLFGTYYATFLRISNYCCYYYCCCCCCCFYYYLCKYYCYNFYNYLYMAVIILATVTSITTIASATIIIIIIIYLFIYLFLLNY